MRALILIAVFSAMAVVLGLALLSVPNLELVTATFFLAGYLLGVRNGAVAAVMGEFIYSVLNPMGSAAPPILIAQIMGMLLAAVLGGVSAQFIGSLSRKKLSVAQNRKYYLIISLYFGLLGLLITLIFDLLTTLSFLLFSGLTLQKFLASVAYGMGFYLAHIGFNTLIFALLLPVVIPRLEPIVQSWLKRAA